MGRLLNMMVRPLGLRVVKARTTELVFLHRYADGYEEYRATQIEHNKRK